MRYNLMKCHHNSTSRNRYAQLLQEYVLPKTSERTLFNPDHISSLGHRHFHSLHDNLHSWSVLQNIYDRQLKSTNKKYACFLLNVSEESFKDFERYRYIWNGANLKVAVDGSANCLARHRIIHTADIVCGDFDSADPKLIDNLRCPTKTTKGFMPMDHQGGPTTLPVPLIIETPDQKETDFTKGIRVVNSRNSDIQFHFGLYYSDGFRSDHLFGLINTLHVFKKNIFLVNIKSNTVSWLLVPGNHSILKPKGQELCSLIAFTGPTEVLTQGLEYNLKPHSPMSFGSLISTSNFCRDDSEGVSIHTNRDLLWSIDLCFKNSSL